MNKKTDLDKYEIQARERISYLIRKYCDGSQQRFADLTGLNKASVSQYVNGKNTPSNLNAAKIGHTFGVNPAWVNGFDVPMENSEPPAKNIILPNAHRIPILGRIACGAGSCLDDSSYDGEFVLDSSIKADYCLIASGDSMIDAGIEHGDHVFIRKVSNYQDGDIYAVVIKGEDVAVLKRVYFQGDRVLLQSCNIDYKPVCLLADEIYIVGRCIGIYKKI